MTPPENIKILFGEGNLTIEDIVNVSKSSDPVALSKAEDFKQRIDTGVKFLEKILSEEGHIYGVTTGYGDSVMFEVPFDLVESLPMHLTRFHGCGLGDFFTPEQSRAILATRLASLTRGYSGVSWNLLDLLVELLNRNILPVIPQEGSVGASGDLTPLSYVAGTLIGERDTYYKGEVVLAAKAFEQEGLSPIKLRPKEGLAIMNGTAVMTALACTAYKRAEYAAKLMARITALSSLALKGNSNHFDDILFSVKPHPGQNQIAKWIQNDLNHHIHPRNSHRLQDRYSIRCAPHVIGVLADSLPWLRSMIENELNSANDNPIIDGIGEHILHGGHFYGGHIAMAMDSMKNCVANLADLADRQIATLVDIKMNHGLPPNLTASQGIRRHINHGFKAIQIGCSAWTAEALKLTMPASVFSRSTECHNQDKVSMGTIAARDCLRILQLTEQVLAATLLAAVQGIRIRILNAELNRDSLTEDVLNMVDDVSSFFDLLEEDRPTDMVLRQTIEYIQNERWTLYEEC